MVLTSTKCCKTLLKTNYCLLISYKNGVNIMYTIKICILSLPDFICTTLPFECFIQILLIVFSLSHIDHLCFLSHVFYIIYV